MEISTWELCGARNWGLLFSISLPQRHLKDKKYLILGQLFEEEEMRWPFAQLYNG
jgi:hypothetical protein